MQPFIKMKKKTGMTESTRQVLNKAIDLLHRLSNKKLSEESARRELGTILSTHYLEEGWVEAHKKIKLQLLLEEANDVITQLDKGKIPLYEAIMLVNRIVVTGVNKEPPKIPEIRVEALQMRPKINPYEEDLDYINGEFDSSGDQRERNLQVKTVEKIAEKIVESAPLQSDDNISILLNRVLINKKQLEEAISDLNGSLQTVGFELRAITK